MNCSHHSSPAARRPWITLAGLAVAALMAGCSSERDGDVVYKPSKAQLEALPHTHEPRPARRSDLGERPATPKTVPTGYYVALLGAQWGCVSGMTDPVLYEFDGSGSVSALTAAGLRRGTFVSANAQGNEIDANIDGRPLRWQLSHVSSHVLQLRDVQSGDGTRCYMRHGGAYEPFDIAFADQVKPLFAPWTCDGGIGAFSLEQSGRVQLGGATAQSVLWRQPPLLALSVLDRLQHNGLFGNVRDYEIDITTVAQGAIKVRPASGSGWASCRRN